jgi:hypothetical protein
LRAAVNTALDGSFKPKSIAVTVLERGVVREHFEVDYTTFPYQSDRRRAVRIGANTHGTDWTMRSLRVYYAD